MLSVVNFDGQDVLFLKPVKSPDYFDYRTYQKGLDDGADWAREFRWEFQKYARELIKKRGKVCEICKVSKSRLVCHHINPLRYNNLSDENDFLTVCSKCHKHYHGIYRLRKTKYVHFANGSWVLQVSKNHFRDWSFCSRHESESDARLACELLLEHGFIYTSRTKYIRSPVGRGNRGWDVHIKSGETTYYHQTFLDEQSAITARDRFINYGIAEHFSVKQARKRQNPLWGIFPIHYPTRTKYKVRLFDKFQNITVHIGGYDSLNSALEARNHHEKQERFLLISATTCEIPVLLQTRKISKTGKKRGSTRLGCLGGIFLPPLSSDKEK